MDPCSRLFFVSKSSNYVVLAERNQQQPVALLPVGITRQPICSRDNIASTVCLDLQEQMAMDSPDFRLVRCRRQRKRRELRRYAKKLIQWSEETIGQGSQAAASP